MKPIKINDVITLTKFAYINTYGGTGMTDWEYDEKWYGEPVKAIVIKEWDDYECGQRGWALPDQNNKELIKYMKRNCKEGSPDEFDIDKWNEESGVYIILWSEFDTL
jgi:hypothetical protein